MVWLDFLGLVPWDHLIQQIVLLAHFLVATPFYFLAYFFWNSAISRGHLTILLEDQLV
jgi:hypothetical protein